MAGDWLKIRTDLADDPAVIAIADAMDLREEFVVGLLHCFWAWVDKQCADGIVVGISIESIERRLRLDGLLVQMCRVGWLVYEQEDGQPILRIPKFERHLGENAKSRAYAAERQRKSRHGAVTKNCDTSVTPVTNICDTSVTREEKKREEKNKSNADSSSTASLSVEQAADVLKLEFPTTSGEPYKLPQSKLEEYRETFSHLDVNRHIRRAWQFLQDNPRKRKTVGGMPKFLSGWLGRQHDTRGSPSNGKTLDDVLAAIPKD